MFMENIKNLQEFENDQKVSEIKRNQYKINIEHEQSVYNFVSFVLNNNICYFSSVCSFGCSLRLCVFIT